MNHELHYSHPIQTLDSYFLAIHCLKLCTFSSWWHGWTHGDTHSLHFIVAFTIKRKNVLWYAGAIIMSTADACKYNNNKILQSAQLCFLNGTGPSRQCPHVILLSYDMKYALQLGLELDLLRMKK